MIYIENEGALFKGVDRTIPKEVWSAKEAAWMSYIGKVPKPYEWGYEISEAEAEALIARMRPKPA
jgi:hypothetical protein